ncbi:MAG: hypothetical protein ACT6U0_21740 [Shinella sp.]|uniref:hypothetical protein n=1 Tax=Shinella sp. TaxID=1870904 RepID=UPI004035049C
MASFLKKSILAAVLGLGALTASVPAASAAGLDVTIETVGYRNGFLEVHDNGWRRDRWDRRHDRWDRRNERRHETGRRGRCSPDLAVAKARDFGVRRARVVDMSPRRVVVEGYRHGGFSRIVFVNDRGCPTMWR